MWAVPKPGSSVILVLPVVRMKNATYPCCALVVLRLQQDPKVLRNRRLALPMVETCTGLVQRLVTQVVSTLPWCLRPVDASLKSDGRMRLAVLTNLKEWSATSRPVRLAFDPLATTSWLTAGGSGWEFRLVTHA